MLHIFAFQFALVPTDTFTHNVIFLVHTEARPEKEMFSFPMLHLGWSQLQGLPMQPKN